VLNLEIQNKALLLKNLHKFHNNLDIPWVKLIRLTYYNTGRITNTMEGSFWWKSHLKLLDTYKSMAKCNRGYGKTILFWTDMWEDSCLHHQLPHLVSFAKRTYVSVYDVISQEFLEDLFHLPVSQQAFQEFEVFEQICTNATNIVQGGDKDSWSYIWGTGQFSTKKAYNIMIEVRHTPEIFSWIWKSSCQAKNKFFFWLLLLDRLNTRNLLTIKNFTLPSYSCTTLQCNEEETLVHLFWTCPFVELC
jgi:hypothetical protein